MPPQSPKSSAACGCRRTRPATAICSPRRSRVHAEKLGVQFRLGTTIEGLIADGSRITGVATSAGVLQADAYVMALGSWSPRLLRPLGISVPVYPIKGYSITVPIADADAAPVSTVMDESYKVAITRLGDRIRVGGTAEVSGYSNHAASGATRRRSINR